MKARDVTSVTGRAQAEHRHSPPGRACALTTRQGMHTHHQAGLAHSPPGRACVLTTRQGLHAHHQATVFA